VMCSGTGSPFCVPPLAIRLSTPSHCDEIEAHREIGTSHFATDPAFPAGGSRWQKLSLSRHIVRMKHALDLVETTRREKREPGNSITTETAHELEGYARKISHDQGASSRGQAC
jgi:hypothetical protein